MYMCTCVDVPTYCMPVNDSRNVNSFKNWLEMDKPVLDPTQDLPKGSQPVKIFFSFK